MSPGLEELFCEHAARSLEKQTVLSGLLDDSDDWAADLDAGTITLGRHTWRCQLLGSESEVDDTWLWGWANNAGYSPDVLDAANQLRALGEQRNIPELTDRKLRIDVANGHQLAMVAAGVCGANAYYRGPYDGGAAFLLIQDPAFPPPPAAKAVNFVNTFSTLIRVMTVPNHRKALLAYARQHKLTATESGSAVKLRFPTGEVAQANFDAQNRLAKFHLDKPRP